MVILLEGMEFYAYHGWHEEEQIIGNKYLIDLNLKTNLEKATETDDIRFTIDYEEIYEVVKHQMGIKSRLLENVAERIVCSLLKTFPLIKEVEIRIAKLHPPLNGKVEKVSIVLKRQGVSGT